MHIYTKFATDEKRAFRISKEDGQYFKLQQITAALSFAIECKSLAFTNARCPSFNLI
jgi:hypothetical protein